MKTPQQCNLWIGHCHNDSSSNPRLLMILIACEMSRGHPTGIYCIRKPSLKHQKAPKLLLCPSPAVNRDTNVSPRRSVCALLVGFHRAKRPSAVDCSKVRVCDHSLKKEGQTGTQHLWNETEQTLLLGGGFHHVPSNVVQIKSSQYWKAKHEDPQIEATPLALVGGPWTRRASVAITSWPHRRERGWECPKEADMKRVNWKKFKNNWGQLRIDASPLVLLPIHTWLAAKRRIKAASLPGTLFRCNSGNGVRRPKAQHGTY